ncbi:polysaccharide lyase [Microvirga aerilata]|uniref:polysaccharide lyase n=1 Tax=Microvirga aerilata TaxID=670292 RepID=UPI00363FDB49
MHRARSQHWLLSAADVAHVRSWRTLPLLPDRSARCGDSIQAGAWTFPVGRWVTVQQEIELSPNEEHGDAVRIWIDEALVMEQAGLRLRDNREVAIAGLLFSTFFGGADASWASPTDQFADFTGFTIKWSPQ